MHISPCLGALLLAAVLLAGCAGGGNFAPVSDRYSPPQQRPAVYIVQRGDTLYSIAWRYGMDFRALAAANRIAPPYRIFPQQRILLRQRPAPAQAAQQPRAPKVQVARPNKAVESNSRPAAPASRAPAPAPPATAQNGWQWPVEGRVLQGFRASGREHKGIDIAGKMGEPVYAAAAGTVVYAGSGLVGYGKLVIVKHDQQYLSAYAHNSRLLVGEGESVKKGQPIARVGDSGTDSVKLHFEIRRDGAPMDPLRLLPKRS